MKALICIFVALPVLAQQAAAPPASQTPAPAPASNPAPAPAAQTTTGNAASPVPTSEPWLSGYVDLGYLWVTGVGGSYDAYSSIIDVHSGPKLLGADFTLTDPKHRWFDTIQVQSTTWGAEPAESVHVEVKKSALYDFNADFRDFAYFDMLPSFADPLLSQGVVLDEQSFNERRRIAAVSLDVLPGNWWSPYFAWDHDSNGGTGATVFVGDSNEFPVPNTMRDLTDLYRGGVRFEKPHFHVTLEEGGTFFNSNETLYQTPGSVNFGNSPAPVFGQNLYLDSLLAGYGINGSSAYSKGLFTANPTSWLDIYGQFMYSQPKTNVNYQQYDAGNLYLQSEILFYSSEQEIINSAADQPHTTGSFGAEIRPFKRVRIVESWMTDRMHDAGSAVSLDTLLVSGSPLALSALLDSTLVTNYNQESIDLFFDASSKLTLRGGYRYVWGDGLYAFLPPAGLASSAQEQLRQNVGVGSATFRPSQKISLTGEVEGASSSGVYFRTSLYNYQKVRAQVHYQPLQTLSVSGDFMLLDNQNPLAGTNYEYTSHQESLSLYWSPHNNGTFDIQGSYTRSDLKSNIGYLEPEDLSPEVSSYRDEGHTATALLDLALPHGKRFAPKLSAGGSLFISHGSRPTSYYQPVVKLWVPLGKHVSWFSDWQYYGYGEAFFLYEGFRTNLVTTGLRLTR